MDKICFVVGLYGDEVNGGAEKHCKMLAERATDHFDVEVLTSVTNNYTTFTPFYEEGESLINGVTIRRFKTISYDERNHKLRYKHSRYGRKIRRFLFKLGLLEFISSLFPKWNLFLQKELAALRSHGLYSPDLIEFIRSRQDDYAAVFLLSYPCPNFYDINKFLLKKTILIPTAHEEGDFFRSYLSHLFTEVNHIAFNTLMEKNLCVRIFGKKMSTSSILAVGTELSEGTSYQHIQQKFDLPDRYILYFGRIAKEKIGDLIDWFLGYKSEYNDTVKLVLTGGIFMERCNHPDIIYTGFVSESEKTSLIQHCKLVINPSDRESLSLLLLETMQLGKPSLVNGKSAVLRQHCIDSDFAADYYISKSDFIKKLHKLLIAGKQNEEIIRSEKAIHYVNQHYSWKKVIDRLTALIVS